jgi:uncharacterized membrane protein
VQNPHPLLVHFPIAFLFGFVAATFLALVVRRPGVERFARACLFVGTAAAAVTVVSGFLAEQSVARVAGAANELEKHRLAGYAVLALGAVLTAVAVVAPRHPQHAAAIRGATLAGALVLGGTLAFAAREGGELVHHYGVGTRLTGPNGPLRETGDPDMPRGTRPAVPTGKDFR